MKKIISFLAFSFIINTAFTQNNRTLSFDGMGAIKMWMPLEDLEKLLQKKIILKVIGVDSIVRTETIHVTHKGVAFEVDLINLGARDDTPNIDGITTKSPLFKTSSGIGVGADKMKVIAAYANYEIVIGPEMDYDEQSDKIKVSKTHSYINVSNDENLHTLSFSLVNNKVVSVTVFHAYEN